MSNTDILSPTEDRNEFHISENQWETIRLFSNM